MTSKKPLCMRPKEEIPKAKTTGLLKNTRQLRSQNKKLIEQNKKLELKLRKSELAIKELTYNLGRFSSEMDEEMETAKKIQEGLMPKILPDMINIKSAAVYIPASKVGGDLYDIFNTPSQKTAVLIFDVSGHGVPAALVGAMAKMLFSHFIEITESPAEVFRLVNKQMCNLICSEQYLTAFLGIIDPVRNVMTYSRAGHVPPLVYHKRTGQISKLDSRGFFIGHSALLNIVEYWETTINLEPEDRILFYTDGITECANNQGKLYGNERLKTVYRNICALKGLNDVLNFIISDQDEFRNGTPLRDDFTLLCIELGNSQSLLADSGFICEDQPEIRIVYTYADIDKTSAAILKSMDMAGYNDKCIKQFKICIYEMLANALLHGNRNNPSKRVVVFYKTTPVSVTISVMDEGKGFDYNSIPNPILPENRMKENGRGLFLIRHYSDEVSFNQVGNRITIRKYHEGDHYGNF